ncbi:MAG: hypothetical protein ACYC4B_01880, partial [Pirellulaceae bacterium]
LFRSLPFVLVLVLVLVIVTRNRFPFLQPRLFPPPLTPLRFLIVLLVLLEYGKKGRLDHETRRLRTMLDYDYQHEHEVGEATIGEDANMRRDG